MKTLIFNGSPRKSGDTVSLINALKNELAGEINQIDAYYSDIQPCNDCRFCFTHTGCAIKDGMQSVYSKIDDADNIVIASPVYFSLLTGPLLNLLSRLQYFYVSEHFRNETVIKNKKRNGIILLAGGGDGSPKKAMEAATCFLHLMKADIIGTVCSHNTNAVAAKDDERAIAEIKAIASKIQSHG